MDDKHKHGCFAQCDVSKFVHSIVVALLILGSHTVDASAQPSSSDDSRRTPLDTVGWWDVSIGNPQAVGSGITFVLGHKQDVGMPGRSNRIVRGVLAASSVGIGGATVRAGWTRLRQFDVVAAADGWSAEAVYVRPWLLQWGLQRNTNYLGGGFTFRRGQIHLSAAMLTNVSHASTGIAATVNAAMSLAEF